MPQLPTPQVEPISEGQIDTTIESGEQIESVTVKLTPEAKKKIAEMKRGTLKLSWHHDVDLANEVELLLEKNNIPPSKSVADLKQERAAQIQQLEQNLNNETSGERKEEFAEQRKELEEHLRVGNIIEKLRAGHELEADERQLAAQTLETQGWQKLLTELKPGDRLISVLVPSDAHVSMKNLNALFGEQTVNAFIVKRKQILQELFNQNGITALNQSYKDGYFKTNNQLLDSGQLHEILTQANMRITQELRLFLQHEKELAADDPNKLKILQNYEQDIAAKSYEMTFGLSTVGTPSHEQDLSHIEHAVSKSIKGALLAQESKNRDNGHLGSELTPEKMEDILAKILSKRDMLITTHQNTITNAEGHSFPIFIKDGQGNLMLNFDLVRDIRTDKFIPSPEHKGRVADIQEYRKMINILDIIKPFTHEEFNGVQTVHGTNRSLAENVSQKQELITDLRTGKPYDRQNLITLLSSEGKDPSCTSKAEFHTRALQEQQCSYINIDALDVGLSLLQEFDHLLRQVSQGSLSFDAASLLAGDQTTKNMRQFRSTITEIVKNQTGMQERPLMAVGGDEALLAIPVHSILDKSKLLLALQEEGRLKRVIEKTVLSESERTSHPESDGEQRKTEHLRTLKETEDGASAAKEMERKIRTLHFEIDALPKQDPVRNSITIELSNMHLSPSAITKEKNTTLVIRKDAEPIPLESVFASLQDLVTRTHQRFEELTLRYQEQFPHAGIVPENIRQVTKLENLLGQNSELFLNIINKKILTT